MIKPSFRDEIIQSVEQVIESINNQGFKVEIETDDNGELIKFKDRKVVIQFAYTYEIEKDLLDFRLFTLEFYVSGSVTVTRFDNKSFDVTKLIKDTFHKIYTPIKKTIAKDKTDYGFNRAMEQLNKGLKTMESIFNANDFFYEISDYLTKLGFEIPVDEVVIDRFPLWVDNFRKDNQEVYSEMIVNILERQEKVNLVSRVGVIA